MTTELKHSSTLIVFLTFCFCSYAVGNSAPVAVDDSATTALGAVINIDVLANDSDADGDLLTVISFTYPAFGSIVLNADDTFTYTQNMDFYGHDSFEYSISDGELISTATVEIMSIHPDIAISIISVYPDIICEGTITEVVHTTTIVNTGDVPLEGVPASYGGMCTDGILDPGEICSHDYMISISQETRLTVSVSALDTVLGTSVHDEDETIILALGLEGFPDFAGTDMGEPVSGNVLDNDNCVLAVESHTDPDHGLLVLNKDTGHYIYAPDDDFVGEDSFTYKATNGVDTTNPILVTITVQECKLSIEDPVWADEDDKMVLPYDTVDLRFRVVNNGTALSNARLNFSFNAGPDWQNDPLISFAQDSVETGPLAGKGEDGSEIVIENTMLIAGTSNADNTDNEIMEIVVREKKLLSLKDTIKVTLDCASQGFILSPRKAPDEGGEILSIQYPDLWKLATDDDRSPPTPADVGNFYLQGDDDFHHPNSTLVRKYAVEAAVWPDRVFLDKPSDVAHNIYEYISGLMKDADPGNVGNDVDIVARIEDGTLEPEKEKYKFVCIIQAYLFGSFARTIGLPAREMDVALGSSVWQVGQHAYTIRYYQEAAIQIWYDGDWYFYDTFSKTTNPYDYFDRMRVFGKPCIAYRAWYSYDRRYSSVYDWRGHDFSITEDWGSPALFSGWKHLEDGVKPGFMAGIGSPVHTYLSNIEGNITGYMNGNILEEIPNSFYIAAGSRFSTNAADPTAFWEAKETIFAPGNGSSEDYSIVMTGTDDGHYDLILAYVHADGQVDGSTIQFDISKDETHTYNITVSPSGEVVITGVPARIDFEPATMNLNALGRWVTCYIELPESFDVGLIDGETVQLNGIASYIGKENWAKAEANQWNIVDHDEDGVPERMVKFDALALQHALFPGDATLMVCGELMDGTAFEGTDTVKVIDPLAK